MSVVAALSFCWSPGLLRLDWLGSSDGVNECAREPVSVSIEC